MPRGPNLRKRAIGVQRLQDKRHDETIKAFCERIGVTKNTVAQWRQWADEANGVQRIRRIGYAAYYSTETQEDREAQRAALYAADIHEFFEDEIRGFRPHSPGRRDGLKMVRAMLKPGDEVVVTSINRLGYGPMQLMHWMATLQIAKVRMLDVEALYGQEEPPAWWSMEYAANACGSLYEKIRNENNKIGHGGIWVGVGWTVKKGFPSKAMWERQTLGEPIVEMVDRDGMTAEQVAEAMSAKKLFYRSTSQFCNYPWTAIRVAEWYVAAKKGYPRPRLFNKSIYQSQQTRGTYGETFLHQMRMIREGYALHEVGPGTLDLLEQRMGEVLGVPFVPVLTPLEPLYEDDLVPDVPTKSERREARKQRAIDRSAAEWKAKLLEQFPEHAT